MSVKHGKPQSRLVNIYKPSEIRAWAKYLDCTQQDIRDAVHAFGVVIEDVEDWIRINVVR